MTKHIAKGLQLKISRLANTITFTEMLIFAFCPYKYMKIKHRHNFLTTKDLSHDKKQSLKKGLISVQAHVTGSEHVWLETL